MADASGSASKEAWARFAVNAGYAVVPVAEGSGLPLMAEEVGRSVLVGGPRGARHRTVLVDGGAHLDG